MRNSNAGKVAIFSTLAVSLLFGTSLSAESYKKISRTIDVAAHGSVQIEASVAEMEIEFYDGDEIELEIELESNGHWFAWRRGDVDHVELEVRTTENKLFLGIVEQKVEQHWRVKMPSKLAIGIDVGVGDIELEGLSNNLAMELGVGSVRVEIDDTDYAVIHASVGVGDTAIKGFSGEHVDNERTFMSSDSYYYGDGELEIDIEVGVGDVEVRSR
ncbi:MAG: hypothetical protein COB20_10840 [SAR86 cluster bacterium]|uniref:Adhesin domain-containing protein n=1 Tax=SAR86 cluster bacterium TaxID=2030880 RepID=A0A2A4X2S7_9GAMM|nr:MAG: hypothetical protein COB20_10840 [SAR86 cluster bacterium]